MGQTLREIATTQPVILEATATAADAAQQMRDHDVGDVLVQRDGSLCGIVTDRDIVIRCLAQGEDPRTQKLEDLCSAELATLDANDSVDAAVELVEKRKVRRIPILEGGAPVGIVSLGDLAVARDPKSALGRISAAPADH